MLVAMALGALDREARYGYRLAPPRFPLVLDMEGSTWTPGRPRVPKETRELIRTLSRDNIGWGAPRIHSELLKLGIRISESSISKYMVRQPQSPSQTWRTFLTNHSKQLVSIDFFTVPTAFFQVLYVFIVIPHDRRHLVHFNVTAHPTGLRVRSWKRFPSKPLRNIYCVIETAFMEMRFASKSRL